MNYATAWNLSYYPGTGTFLRTNTQHPVFRYDNNNIYVWDKRDKREVAIGRAELLQLLALPVDNTAPPRANR